MKFNLTRPCGTDEIKCPFRRDSLPGWLGGARAAEIAREVLDEERTFACHKTTGVNGGRAPRYASHCAGALILIHRAGRAHRMTQIAERLGLYEPEHLHADDPNVFSTAEEFIAHHRNTERP